jgi:hypothetical protein
VSNPGRSSAGVLCLYWKKILSCITFNQKIMKKNTCSKCEGTMEDNRAGKYSYCKSCHNSHARENRKKHSELTSEQKLKANCRSYLNVYIKRGIIIKQPCSVCGDPKVEGHHEDYNKPLEVVWLCRPCHMAHHKN